MFHFFCSYCACCLHNRANTGIWTAHSSHSDPARLLRWVSVWTGMTRFSPSNRRHTGCSTCRYVPHHQGIPRTQLKPQPRGFGQACGSCRTNTECQSAVLVLWCVLPDSCLLVPRCCQNAFQKTLHSGSLMIRLCGPAFLQFHFAVASISFQLFFRNGLYDEFWGSEGGSQIYL